MGKTIYFNKMPKIVCVSSVGGPKECGGHLGKYIQIKLKEDSFGQDSFEKAEIKILYTAIEKCISNYSLKESDIECLFAGDLLNQIIASTFSARNLAIPFLGMYNACATFTECLLTGATFIDAGKLNNCICATSSHFSSAERQYRYPLELGSTRPPQAQWTVTGAGACLLSLKGDGPKIVSATIGSVIDYGVTDTNNMGAAMAPAAADTIYNHLANVCKSANDYDLIITGDLGALGTKLLKKLLKDKGLDVDFNHVDCGEMIYNIKLDEYQGGSGAGCSSLVFSSYIYKKLIDKKLKRVLLVATGALLSPTSAFQGESIPSIAHAVEVEIWVF